MTIRLDDGEGSGMAASSQRPVRHRDHGRRVAAAPATWVSGDDAQQWETAIVIGAAAVGIAVWLVKRRQP
jgi:hypothetical protein